MANKISVQLELEGKDAIRTLTALNKGLKKVGKDGTKSIKTMDLALGSFIGNLGSQAILKSMQLLSQGFKASTKDALEFGRAVAEINSIVPRTAQETLALKQQLIGLSNEFGKESQGQAKAFYNILSAGVTDTTKALVFLESANKAAVAGLVDVDTAARGLLSVTNSYTDGSVNAAQASDILFTAVREGRTTFSELADTIGRVASISSAAKVGFDEVAGALAFVTKSGIRTDEAVIGLRGLFTGIIGPTDDVKKAAKSLGIQWDANALQAKGLRGLMNELAVASGGNVEKIRELIPNVRAFNVAVKIAGGDLEDFNRILDETADAGGATDKALSVITDSAAFQFDKLVTQIKNFPLAVQTNFEEPLSDALKAINKFISGQGVILVADAVNIIIDSFKELVVLKDDVSDFFEATGQLASEFVNAVSGIDEVTTENLRVELKELEEQFRKTAETQSILADRDSASEVVDARANRLKNEITLIKDRIDILQQADLADAKIDQLESQRREGRLAKIKEFQEKIAEGKRLQLEQAGQIQAEKEAQDKINAEKELETVLGFETKKFDALTELKLAQDEIDAEKADADRIAKELAGSEEFQFLVDNLGKEKAAKELARIEDITSEQRRLEELKKLRTKAAAQEAKRAEIARKNELKNAQALSSAKVSLLGSTASLLNAANTDNNKGIFLASQGLAAAQIVMSGLMAEAQALGQLGPIAGPPVAALIKVNTGVQLATLAATTLGKFQGGGIVGGSSQVGDQSTIGVNGGEVVFNQRQQKNLFRAVDNGSVGSGAGNTININNPVFMNEEMVGDTIDLINDQVEFNNKRLLSSEVA